MEIQRALNANFAYPGAYAPSLSNPAAGNPTAAASAPWLAPEMSLANDNLRAFWSNFGGAQQDEQVLPFFGRFLADHQGGPQASTQAMGEGDNGPDGFPTFGLPQPGQPGAITQAVGEGDVPPGGFAPPVAGFEDPRPLPAITHAIGEGDTAPRPIVGGNTGDAGARGKTPAFTQAIGEGDA